LSEEGGNWRRRKVQRIIRNKNRGRKCKGETQESAINQRPSKNLIAHEDQAI
jgi:hypothetical protein